MDPDFDRRLSDWMRRAQDGDRLAYEALLTELTAYLTAFVQKRLAEPAWVEDVVQETLISIHQNRHTYDPTRAFGFWLHAIALHRLIDVMRKRRRVHARERLGESDPEDACGGAESAPHQTAFEVLHRALTHLSSQQRQVIRLLKWEGFSVKEVAQSTGMSESSVKVSAHRGYRLLRKLLAEAAHED